MLVAVVGFGSVWRSRFSKNSSDHTRFAQGAYYNTTGILIHGRIRQRPRIVGYARFNGIGGFNPNFPSRMIHRVFECADPCVHQGFNKLLFRHLVSQGETPEFFLVAVRSELVGSLAIGTDGWRSGDTWLLAFSEDGTQQEALLLMRTRSWIRSAVGTFVLEPAAIPRIAKLHLRDCVGMR